MRKTLAAAAAALLAGCSGPLVKSAITSNIVQEDAHNAYLVLNIARAHERGLQVHAWTVNDRPDMERLLDLGVDGIMTDELLTLRDVLASRGHWSGPGLPRDQRPKPGR